MSKSYNNLFSKIVDEDNIEKAYFKALKGSNKYKDEAIKFYLDEVYNLKVLRNSLIDKTYTFDGYIRFKVYEPKERIIDAPHFKDKIVQLAINNILKDVYNPCFIYDSYACIDNKGTHKAVDRVQYFMRKAGWEYGEGATIIKLDIRKFFYTIDRDVLKSIFPKKIKSKDTLSLLYLIIDSSREIDDLGLPLGNTLSQLFANIIMNEFDQFCKRKLKIKYFVRYADDVIAIVKNKKEAKEILKTMILFLNKEIKLYTNDSKTKIFPIEQGVNAYGFKIYKTHRLLRNDSKKKIKRKAKKIQYLLVEEKMSIEKAEQILNSWMGHAKHANSYHFIRNLTNKYKYIYLNKKGILKINTSILKGG